MIQPFWNASWVCTHDLPLCSQVAWVLPRWDHQPSHSASWIFPWNLNVVFSQNLQFQCYIIKQLFLFCSMQEKHANLLDLVRHGIEDVFKTVMKNQVAWVCARYFLTLRFSVVWSTSLPLGQTCLSAVRAHAAATLTLLWGWFLWRVQKQY